MRGSLNKTPAAAFELSRKKKMRISRYKYYLAFILLFVVVCFVGLFYFCFVFLVQGEHSVYLDYFILSRCQHDTSVFLGETEEHKNRSVRSDHRSVQARILPSMVAGSRCSEQSTEEAGPEPRGLHWCPC